MSYKDWFKFKISDMSSSVRESKVLDVTLCSNIQIKTTMCREV